MLVAVKGNEHDRVGIRLDLGDDGIVGRVGQAATHPGDFVAHIGGGGIRVPRELELDIDLAALGARL